MQQWEELQLFQFTTAALLDQEGNLALILRPLIITSQLSFLLSKGWDRCFAGHVTEQSYKLGTGEFLFSYLNEGF